MGRRLQMTHRGSLGFLIVLAWFAASAWPVLAVTGSADSDGMRLRDPLATKQQIVRDRMTQLEDRMFRLAEKLKEAEPKQAERIDLALRRTRELLIRRHMEEVITRLDEGDLTGASEAQMAIVKDLERVLKLLLEDPDNTEERQEEIDRLQELREQVTELLERQRELKERADAAPRLEQMLAAIRAAIARLEHLIEEQEAVIAETARAANEGDHASSEQLGEAQGKVREDTEALGEAMAESSGAVGEDLEGEPGGREARAGESDAPGAAGEDEARAPRDAPDAPGDAPADAGQRGVEPPSERSIEAGLRGARQDVRQAAREMRAAEQDLEREEPGQALPMEWKASESLQRALRELRQQEEATEQLLDQSEAARQERALQQDTQRLAEEMRGEPSGDAQAGGQQAGDPQEGGEPGAPGGEPGEPGDGAESGQDGPRDAPQEPAPGTYQVEQAGDRMGEAAENLERDAPSEASRRQQEAIEELERARQELEQALEQLRREQQEEILRGLEARFRAMLTQQLAVNQGTDLLEEKGREEWVHADELRLAGLAQDQNQLAEQAGQALHILKEEGTTIVFPVIVEQLRGDMIEVARRLREKNTGSGTRHIQADIVGTLEELIEAIKSLRRQLQSGEMSPGGGSNAPPPPLLPDSAELKLLRSCQERVNRQTETFAAEHGEQEQWEPDNRRAIERIADRQEEVAEMARKMNERITGQ